MSNKQTPIRLAIGVNFFGLPVSVCMTGRGVSTLVQDMNTLAFGENSSSLSQGSKAKTRKIKEEFKIAQRLKERES